MHRPLGLRTLRSAARRLLAALAVAAAAPGAAAGAQGAPPNIVVIMADDLGYADVGPFGSTTIPTPALDALAQEGARLTSFYVHPSCTPSRVALMTGRFPQRVGLDGPIGTWSSHGMPADETTIAEELRARGYRTGFFGKWHLGDSPEQLPLNQGFGDWFGSPWGLLGRPDILLDSRGPDEWSEDLTTWTRRFTDRTLEFVAEAALAGEPFFAVLAHHVPHYPATPGYDFIGTGGDGREYGDSVAELDAGIGELSTLLETLEIADNTLIIFLSDNGPANAFGAYQAGSAAPFSGWKGSTLEGGVRVPCIVRWPLGIAPGIELTEPVHIADLYPTFLALADGHAPLGGDLDGRDVRPILQGGALLGAESVVYYPGLGTNVDGVRRGQYKLRNGQLFDLSVDPGELIDLAAVEPVVFGELDALRQGLSLDLQLDSRAPAPTTRRAPTWRGDAGLGPANALAGGDLWAESGQGWSPWVVADLDPVGDVDVVLSPSTRPLSAPARSLRAPDPAGAARLVRTGTEFAGLSAGPMTLAVWLRVPPAGLSGPSVLLDLGDAERGTSIVFDDLGEVGDDGVAGRFDDARIALGGSASPASVSAQLDWPNDGELHLLAFVTGPFGSFDVFLDGLPVASDFGGSQVHWGGEEEWCLFGVEGELGASPTPPPVALAGLAEVAGLRVWDRALPRQEVEVEYSRYNAYRFCDGQLSTEGTRGVLDLRGSFRPSERRLFADVTGLAPNSVGVLLAGTAQGRNPLGDGFLCLAAGIRRVRVAFVDSTGSSLGIPVLEPLPSGPIFAPTSGSRWDFQFVYRDSGIFRPTSAVSVLFGF